MISATSLLGAAGEHYVLSELLRRGFVAALAPQGVPNMDILVADTDGDQLCAIQVKTRSGRGGDGGWHMRPKHEKHHAERLFYCCVDFGNSARERPNVYVIPSQKVAEVIGTAHRAWLSNPGKNGRISGVRPCRWTGSGSGFDRGAGVADLELDGAEIAQGGM